MLSVTYKTTDPDLTTTGLLKSRVLGATSTSTADDALFSAAIRAASRWAENYVGRPLSVQTYLETVPGYGTRRLMLSRTPIRSVELYESTEDDSAQVTSTQFRVEDPEAGILTRDEGWPWTVPTELELEDRPVPGEESAPWTAAYAAGYAYNGLSTDSNNYSTASGSTDTGRTLPEEIEEAVLLKAQSLYTQAVEGGEVEDEQLGDLRVNYRTGGRDAVGGGASPLDASELLLDPYRRIV